jgi:hypothetical protein
MQSDYLQYLKKLLLFSGVIGLISFGISFLLPERFISPGLPFILIFFVSVSLVTHFIALKLIAKKISQFTNFFMISIFVKLIFYSLIIIIYSQINKNDLIPFVIGFFIYYAFFTIFELVELLKLQKN